MISSAIADDSEAFTNSIGADDSLPGILLGDDDIYNFECNSILLAWPALTTCLILLFFHRM